MTRKVQCRAVSAAAPSSRANVIRQPLARACAHASPPSDIVIRTKAKARLLPFWHFIAHGRSYIKAILECLFHSFSRA